MVANYTNIMTNALAARKSFGGGGVRIGSSFKRSNSSKGYEDSLGGAQNQSQAVNPMHKWRMEKGAENKLHAGVKKTGADVESTRADIKTNALKTAVDVKRSEAETAESKQRRTAKGLQNAASFASQLTQDNYASWYKWVSDTNFLPSDMFTSPDEVSQYTPEKAVEYFTKLQELQKPDGKVVSNAIKTHEAELKNKAAEAKAAALVTKQDKTIAAADRRANATNLRKDEKSLADTEAEITGEDEEGNNFLADKNGTAPYVDQYNKLAERLGTGYEYVWDENAEVEVPGEWYGTNKAPGYVKRKVGEAPVVDEVPPPPIPENVDANAPQEITTQEEFDALQSGATYFDNEKLYRKP